MDIKSGKDEVEAPTYSHLVYDVLPDEKVVVKRPDIVIIEGLNVLQPARVREDGRTGLAISDFFDFSVYVDAATGDIRRWYTDRFLRLRETSFRNPASYFARYGDLSEDEAVAESRRIWDTINGPNLEQNVVPPGAARRWCSARTPTTRCATCACGSSDPVTTARTVPVTTEMDGDELDAGDAWRVARRVGFRRLAALVRPVPLRRRLQPQPGARAPGGAGRRPVPARADRARRGHRLERPSRVVARTIESVSPLGAAGRAGRRGRRRRVERGGG